MNNAWLALLAAIAAFAGAAVGHVVAYLVARRQTALGRKQDALTNLRWAADQALSDDPHRARLGVRYIRAIARSSDLDEDTEAMVDATLAAVVEPAVDEYDGLTDGDRYVETYVEYDEE
jgi:hypothetical protein